MIARDKNIYSCFIDYPKAFTMWIMTNCGKLLKRWEYQTTSPNSRETCMQVKKQQLELDKEQWAGSKESNNSSALSFLYGPTLTSIHDHWKTIALSGRTFISKVISLLFNRLSRLIITFLPRSKHLLISRLQPTCSDFGAQEKKVCHDFHCFAICLPRRDGTRCHDLSFLNA